MVVFSGFVLIPESHSASFSTDFHMLTLNIIYEIAVPDLMFLPGVVVV